MKTKLTIAGIIIAVFVFLGFQTIAPFPYGLIFGIGISGFIIWYTIKQTLINEDSLISYKRADPKTEKEKQQNREAYRILKKKFLEEKISKEEFEKQKKLFDIEDD